MEIKKIINIATLTTSIVSSIGIISLIIMRPWARYARSSNMDTHTQSQSNSTDDSLLRDLNQKLSRLNDNIGQLQQTTDPSFDSAMDNIKTLTQTLSNLNGDIEKIESLKRKIEELETEIEKARVKMNQLRTDFG